MNELPPDPDAPGERPAARAPRMHTAEDDDDGSALFTAEELRAAIVHACADPADAEELARAWASDPIEHPGSFWTEDIFLIVALTAPARAERIRHKLGYTPAEFAARLAAEQRRLPWRFDP